MNNSQKGRMVLPILREHGYGETRYLKTAGHVFHDRRRSIKISMWVSRRGAYVMCVDGMTNDHTYLQMWDIETVDDVLDVVRYAKALEDHLLEESCARS